MKQILKEIINNEMTLLELDNFMQENGFSNSIFDSEEQDWNFGDNSAFAYSVNDTQYNVWFSIINKTENSMETVIKINKIEEI